MEVHSLHLLQTTTTLKATTNKTPNRIIMTTVMRDQNSTLDKPIVFVEIRVGMRVIEETGPKV